MNKPGYKNTSLGWIPEDWEVKRIKDIANINPSKKPQDDTISVSFIAMADVSEDGKVLNEQQSKYGQVKSGFTSFEKYDIIVAKITPCFENGKGALLSNLKHELGFGSTEFHVIRAGETVIPEIIFYHTRLNHFRSSGELNMVGSAGQKRVPTSFVEGYSIPLPPLPEQRRIITILSTWDAAISKEQQLIEALQTRHRALMQQLLSGKKRLKGFDVEWKEIRLGQHFNFVRSYSVSREGLKERDNGSSIFCIHYGDIHSSYESEFLDFNLEKSIPQLAINIKVDEQDFLKDGDIIIADASEDYEGVGESVEVKNIKKHKAVGGLHTIVLRDITYATKEGFRAYLFASEIVKNKLKKQATGTSVYSVTKSTLEKLIFKAPPLPEQTAIANILSTSEKEIQTHRRHLAALQQQKKGLMQVLLTGKVRVKAAES